MMRALHLCRVLDYTVPNRRFNHGISYNGMGGESDEEQPSAQKPLAYEQDVQSQTAKVA